MKKILLCLLLLFSLNGCVQTHAWKYTSETKKYTPPTTALEVIVPPMRDIRKNKNGARATAWLGLIPGVPYSKNQVHDTPEWSPLILNNMKVSEDLAIATAQEINAASIFKNVYFDFNPQKGDLILEGTVKKFRIKTYSAFYGCSFLGIYLWYFGLPAGKIHNDVIIEFQLKDKQGKLYFQKEYSAHTDYLQGLYYNLKFSADFEPLVKEINLKLIQDLQTVAPQIKLRKGK